MTNGRDKQERSLYPCVTVCMCSHPRKATLSCVPLKLNWLCALFLFFPIGTETSPVIKLCCAQVKVKPRHRQIMRGKQPLLSLLLLCLGRGSDLIAYAEQKQGSRHKRCFKYLNFGTHTHWVAEKQGCAGGHLNVSGAESRIDVLQLEKQRR